MIDVGLKLHNIKSRIFWMAYVILKMKVKVKSRSNYDIVLKLYWNESIHGKLGCLRTKSRNLLQLVGDAARERLAKFNDAHAWSCAGAKCREARGLKSIESLQP